MCVEVNRSPSAFCHSRADCSPLQRPAIVSRRSDIQSNRGKGAPTASETVSFSRFFPEHPSSRDANFFLAAKNWNPWRGDIRSRDSRNHGLKVNSWYRKYSGIESIRRKQTPILELMDETQTTVRMYSFPPDGNQSPSLQFARSSSDKPGRDRLPSVAPTSPWYCSSARRYTVLCSLMR